MCSSEFLKNCIKQQFIWEKKKHEVLVNVLRLFYMKVIIKFNKTASHNDFKLGGHTLKGKSIKAIL